jgi:hypothetical protein
MVLTNSLRYSLYLIFHPFDGFWDLKYENRGSIKAASIIVALVVLSYVLRERYTGFLFNFNNVLEVNILTEIISVVLLFVLWTVANWCLTTLMDGKGSYVDIFIATAYSLTPLIIINLPLIIYSNFITIEEGAFYYFFLSLSVIWSGALIILGTMITHEYTMGKTLLTLPCIIVGMGLMVFIGLLFFSVIQKMAGFIYAIYKELVFRI